MDKTVKALAHEFATVRTGRASGAVLEKHQDRLLRHADAAPADRRRQDPRAAAALIEPWDKTALKAIEKAIQASDLGMNPSNDGSVIRCRSRPSPKSAAVSW